MREILFYRTASGHCPVEDFLDGLDARQAQKVLWVLRLVEEIDHVPKQYFKKLEGYDDLWEVRVQFGGNTFRLLGFFEGSAFLILCHGFAKKTDKIPLKELLTAKSRKEDYQRRGGEKHE